MVRSRHRTDDGLFSLVTLWAADPKIIGSLSTRSAARYQKREPSFSDAHRRGSKAFLDRADFINVQARPGWCRNSSRPLGKTHRSALLSGIKIRKVELRPV
jgi:hypothetical protein